MTHKDLTSVQRSQEEFNRKYITASEIKDILGVTRTAIVLARKRGTLPPAIMVDNNVISMWERDFIMPYIEEWKTKLASRRSASNA